MTPIYLPSLTQTIISSWTLKVEMIVAGLELNMANLLFQVIPSQPLKFYSIPMNVADYKTVPMAARPLQTLMYRLKL